MSFDGPDREYLDGEIVERNVTENPHSKAQANLTGFFYVLAKKLPLHVRPELRMRVTPTRYRIADVAVWVGEEPTENVPSHPPLVTIEILSREDRFADLLAKFEEYQSWGVEHVWFVDPWQRKIYVYSATGLTEVPAFQIPTYRVEIPAAEVFR